MRSIQEKRRSHQKELDELILFPHPADEWRIQNLRTCISILNTELGELHDKQLSLLKPEPVPLKPDMTSIQNKMKSIVEERKSNQKKLDEFLLFPNPDDQFEIDHLRSKISYSNWELGNLHEEQLSSLKKDQDQLNQHKSHQIQSQVENAMLPLPAISAELMAMITAIDAKLKKESNCRELPYIFVVNSTTYCAWPSSEYCTLNIQNALTYQEEKSVGKFSVKTKGEPTLYRNDAIINRLEHFSDNNNTAEGLLKALYSEIMS
jgi:hypothetical protein